MTNCYRYGLSPFEYALGESGGSLQLAIVNAQVKWPTGPKPKYPDALHQFVTWMLQPQAAVRPHIDDIVIHVDKLIAKFSNWEYQNETRGVWCINWPCTCQQVGLLMLVIVHFFFPSKWYMVVKLPPPPPKKERYMATKEIVFPVQWYTDYLFEVVWQLCIGLIFFVCPVITF